MGARETRYGTHHAETYARGEGSHAHRHRLGCNRADDSSLAVFLKTSKQGQSEDTRGSIIQPSGCRVREATLGKSAQKQSQP